MARKPKQRSEAQPMVREAVAAYEVRSMAEVFWLAFQSLAPEDQDAFVTKLLDDPEWYEEIEDALSIIQARGEPSRPFEEFVEELKREGAL